MTMGSAPSDNPFFALARASAVTSAATCRGTFAYGVRNSFGLAFDPVSGDLWEQDHGDDSFDELNRVTPGANSDWVQAMGPIARVAEFKAIERALAPGDLQQQRWAASQIADTPDQARARLFMLQGASTSNPKFSWKCRHRPGGIGFLRGDALGAEYANDLFVGASRPTFDNGYLLRLDLFRQPPGDCLPRCPARR